MDRSEFFDAIGPCLALTGGVGMNRDDQRAWLEAAFIALEGIPIGLLQQGAKAAMATADHPSKIVPAIRKAVDEDWAWRKRMRTSPVVPMLPQPKPEPIPHEETQAILKAAGLNLSAARDASRPTEQTGGTGEMRTPTRADYIRLGVDPATLDAIDASGTEAREGGDDAGGSVHDGPVPQADAQQAAA